MTKSELDAALRVAGINSPFFDLHAIDAVSSCKYFSVRDDVQAGCYTFEGFIAAHQELTEGGTSFTFGEVRLLAQQGFVRAVNAMQDEVTLAWQDGVMC